MKILNAVDYSCILAYFVIILLFGFLLRKKAAESITDYFLGNKQLPWWALGMSGTASFLDITGTTLIVSFLYMLGPRGLYIEFRGGAVLVLIFMLIWTGKWHRRSNCMTGAEWQIYRFGRGIGGQFARVITALAMLFSIMVMLAYMAKGVGTFLAMFLPFTPMQCAVVMLGVATIYTMASGFYGVVITDVLQTVIIFFAIAVVTIMAINAVSDYESLGELAHKVTGYNEWTKTAPCLHTSMPKGYEPYQDLLMFSFFYLLRNILGGISSGGDPKYFGARNERECGKLSFLWTWLIMLRWPMMMGFAVLGLFLVNNLFPNQKVLRDSELAIKKYLVQRTNPDIQLDFKNDNAVAEIIPKREWQKQADSIINNPQENTNQTNQLANVLGENWKPEFMRLVEQENVVKNIVPKKFWEAELANIMNSPEKYPSELIAELENQLGDQWNNKLKLLGYEGSINPERILPAVILFDIPIGLRGLLLVALIAASMSTFDSNVNMAVGFFTRDLYQAYLRPAAKNRELILASYTSGVALVCGAFGLAYMSASINDIWGWLIMGVGSALVGPAVLRLYWWRLNPGGVIGGTVVGLPAVIIQRILYPELDERVQFLVFTGISLFGTIIGTYLTKPTDAKVLEHFYKTTRPFGLWGPFKKKLDPQMREQMTREHRNDLLAVPCVLVFQVTLFLMPMQLIIHNFHEFWITLGIWLVASVGMYKFWYKNLAPAQEGISNPGMIDGKIAEIET